MTARLDPAIVLQQIANLKLVYPDVWDDGEEKLLADCLEAETDINELLTVLVDRMQDAKSFAGGIAGRIAELELRQARFEQREKAMRDLAFKVMSAADVRKIEIAEATLSIANGQCKLIGEVDPLTLPDHFRRMKFEADKKAIKAALENGVTVAGYELSNAEPHLTVRTK